MVEQIKQYENANPNWGSDLLRTIEEANPKHHWLIFEIHDMPYGLDELFFEQTVISDEGNKAQYLLIPRSKFLDWDLSGRGIAIRVENDSDAISLPWTSEYNKDGNVEMIVEVMPEQIGRYGYFYVEHAMALIGEDQVPDFEKS